MASLEWFVECPRSHREALQEGSAPPKRYRGSGPRFSIEDCDRIVRSIRAGCYATIVARGDETPLGDEDAPHLVGCCRLLQAIFPQQLGGL